MTSGGSGAWRSRGRREAMPNPVSRVRPSAQFDQNIGRLDVLVDEAALVRLAERGDDADGEAQKASHLHRFADQSLERFAARILEQQHRSSAFAPELERPRRPCGVEFVPQFIFVGEAIED